MEELGRRYGTICVFHVRVVTVEFNGDKVGGFVIKEAGEEGIRSR